MVAAVLRYGEHRQEHQCDSYDFSHFFMFLSSLLFRLQKYNINVKYI